MLFNKKITCIIPARLASTRFPHKMLATLANKPLLAWVWDAAQQVSFFDSILFAIDDERIARLLETIGARFEMTSPQCSSGTDRLVELYQSGRIQSDIWVNWQGDEPFITSQMIMHLLQSIDNHDAEMWTLKKCIVNPEDITSPQVAKVVCGASGHALYFSRSPIPFVRDERDYASLIAKKVYYKHVGLYAYTTKALEMIASLPKDNFLENAEKLEQLRFLSHGLSYKVHETDTEVVGIDTPQDLIKAENYIRNKGFSL